MERSLGYSAACDSNAQSEICEAELWSIAEAQLFTTNPKDSTASFYDCLLCYSRRSVELFLNLVWAVLSILLIAGWIWAICKGHAEFQWTTLVAFALLLVLLLPAISMTDDRVAMSTPMELEHMMRSSEAPLGQAAVLGLFSMFGAIVLVVLNMASPQFYCRICTCIFAEALLAGFIRAVGVRPPPAAGIFAS